MRVLPLLALCLALLAPGAPVRAGDEPDAGRLTLEDLYGGKRRFTKGIPDWRWRPGHAQLVRVERRSVEAASGPDGKSVRRPPRRILVAMDPETGEVGDLLDLTALQDLVPGKGTRMAGIGRAGPPPMKWSEDGKALCVVVKGDLVWVDLENDVRRRLTTTDSPMADLNIAPDGRHVSFSKANELWVVPTTKGEAYALTSDGSKTLLNATLDWLYPEELGFRTAAWWSPDGKRIAYLQMDQSKVPRYRVPSILPLRSEGREMFYPKAGDPNPKVRVGVVPVKGGKTTWLQVERALERSPEPEYVVRVTWAPDASRVCVVTLDRAQRLLRIHACHPSTGKGEVVYREEHDAWIAPPTQPEWVGGDVFLWARGEGCRRWYLGAWDAAAKMISMSPASPEDFHCAKIIGPAHEPSKVLYVGMPSGEVTQGVFVREGERLVRPAWASDDAMWMDLDADATGTFALSSVSSALTPTHRVLARLATGEALREIGAARGKDLDDVRLAQPEYGQGVFLPELGGRMLWRLWKPHDFDPEKRYGLIVHVYAGPGSRMVRNTWGRGPLLTTLLCQRGFLVLEVDGPGTGGQGWRWMTAVQGRLGIPETDAQASVAKEILARGYVDPERVGIWGWSYGGTMACNALTMRPDVFKAGVAVAPVTDWRLYDTIYTERYMGLPKENAKGYEETSSITHAKKLEGHLLLMHGLGDDNVHAQNTLRLVEAFIKAKKTTYETMLYPRRGHGIGGASLDVFTRLVEFFERHIGPR